MVIKCVKHVPGQTGINFDEVRESIRREALNRKTNAAVAAFLADLKNKSHPKILLKKAELESSSVAPESTAPSSEPVAFRFRQHPHYPGTTG